MIFEAVRCENYREFAKDFVVNVVHNVIKFHMSDLY